MAVIQAPLEMIEAVADLRLPPKADHRLQDLMDRNNEGTLTPAELFSDCDTTRAATISAPKQIRDPRATAAANKIFLWMACLIRRGLS